MGGDGSLGSLLDKLTSDPYIVENLSHIRFAPLPYGTGNDLSRALGWGGKVGVWNTNLETLALALIKAEPDELTIW